MDANEIKKILTIDLAEYGAEGTIEMRKPSPRKEHDFLNLISRYSVKGDSGMTIKEGAPLGDIRIISMLMYVNRAPFALTLDGYLDFTDRLEPEMAAALQKRMEEGASEVASDSPFAASTSRGTASSE